MVAALDDQVTPEWVLATAEPMLRATGLSANKTASVRDLAARVLDGRLSLDPHRLSRRSDQDITEDLSAVRGIGTWSAQMFLMHQLRRPDIWPTGDLGVRKGYALAWNISVPTPKELDLLGEPFRPYRSVLAWYCWQAANLERNAVPSGVK